MPAATVTIANGATWQEVAADRQAYRDLTVAAVDPPLPYLTDLPLNTISLAKEILTPDELEITESTVEELAPKLADGTLSAVTVAKAFLRRAGLAQKARALERASYLDEYLNTHGKPLGPLHGIPISVKEHVGMADSDHNAGFVGWVGRLCKEDPHICQILWSAGAVFYARTTQPQSLMHIETSSNIYGVTTNPFNTTLTSGGSSGGEGALVGFRGSVLGIATDIGGSIRSPAANNGVYGFKPTTGRLPMSGLIATMGGAEQIVPTIGPISTSLEGCKLFTKTLVDAKPWYKEPSLLPFPWKEENFFYNKNLKIAVLWNDGVVKPHPPVTRALQQIVQKLKTNGKVDIVEWKPYKHDLAWEIIANLYFSDGGAEELAAINESGEPILPLTKHILAENPYVQAHSINSMWRSIEKRDAYRVDYAHLWNSTAVSETGESTTMVDVILCPVGPGAAPKINTSKWWGYTSQWNLLDYPALVFPVDQVDIEKDSGKQQYHPINEKDKFNWELWEEYGAEGYKDAPISLQLVGRRYEDEKLFQALEIIKAETSLPFVNYL